MLYPKEITCPVCKTTRLVDYRTVWSIKMDKSTARCHPCALLQTGFKKGNTILSGKKQSVEQISRRVLKLKGKKRTQEFKDKCRMRVLEGIPNFTMKGKSHRGIGGSEHWRWIQDRTQLKKFDDDSRDRRSSAYNNWRREVWARDNWKCKISNQDCAGRIEAHHILGWTAYPELRYDINNGITLCHAHHPRKRAEEKLLIPEFQRLVGVSLGN